VASRTWPGAGRICGSIAEINEREGNAAAWTYGPVKGVGRFFFPHGAGVWEIVSFPFATNKKATYKQPYKSNIRGSTAAMTNSPPELGFESRYRYTAATPAVNFAPFSVGFRLRRKPLFFVP